LIPDPVVVFEVPSVTSEHTDQTIKKLEYQAVPSIRRYILINQTKVMLTVHLRPDEGAWHTTHLAKGAMLELPEIGITIPVDELYEGVTFEG
jgi:Uma2 family endonuclease